MVAMKEHIWNTPLCPPTLLKNLSNVLSEKVFTPSELKSTIVASNAEYLRSIKGKMAPEYLETEKLRSNLRIYELYMMMVNVSAREEYPQ